MALALVSRRDLLLYTQRTEAPKQHAVHFFFIVEELHSRYDACSLLRSVSRLISDLYLESFKDILCRSSTYDM